MEHGLISSDMAPTAPAPAGPRTSTQKEAEILTADTAFAMILGGSDGTPALVQTIPAPAVAPAADGSPEGWLGLWRDPKPDTPDPTAPPIPTDAALPIANVPAQPADPLPVPEVSLSPAPLPSPAVPPQAPAVLTYLTTETPTDPKADLEIPADEASLPIKVETPVPARPTLLAASDQAASLPRRPDPRESHPSEIAPQAPSGQTTPPPPKALPEADALPDPATEADPTLAVAASTPAVAAPTPAPVSSPAASTVTIAAQSPSVPTVQPTAPPDPAAVDALPATPAEPAARARQEPEILPPTTPPPAAPMDRPVEPTAVVPPTIFSQTNPRDDTPRDTAPADPAPQPAQTATTPLAPAQTAVFADVRVAPLADPDLGLLPATPPSWRLAAQDETAALTRALQTATLAPRDVAGQITLAVSQSAQPQIEIRLDPPELGRVQLRLNPTEGGGMQAIVMAERPETQDFLRRHADALVRDLTEAGYGEVTLTFSTGSDASTQRDAPSDRRYGVPFDTAPISFATLPEPPRRPAGDGLDIRL